MTKSCVYACNSGDVIDVTKLHTMYDARLHARACLCIQINRAARTNGRTIARRSSSASVHARTQHDNVKPNTSARAARCYCVSRVHISSKLYVVEKSGSLL